MELVAAPLSRKQSVTEFTGTPRRLQGQTPFPQVRRNIMRTMNRSTAQPLLTRLFCAVSAVVLVAVSLFAGQMAQAAEPGLRLTPEQRRDMWQRMTPEQRQQWRNSRSPEERQRALQRLSPEQRREMGQQLSPEQRELIRQRMTPEQRQELRGQITPDEREAMRQRFHERQQNGRPPNSDQSVPPPRRQLSPEERQRLREQIEQARRDVYRRSDGGNRGPNK
jgi:MgtE intracellular N domain